MYESNLGQIGRAIDQQAMGAYLQLQVQGEIADLPDWDAVIRAELVERIKTIQARRALHYSRARNLLGLHD
jgi:hypothetical protein